MSFFVESSDIVARGQKERRGRRRASLLASFQHLLLSKNARFVFVFVFVVAKAKEALVVLLLLPRMDARCRCWCRTTTREFFWWMFFPQKTLGVLKSLRVRDNALVLVVVVVITVAYLLSFILSLCRNARARSEKISLGRFNNLGFT